MTNLHPMVVHFPIALFLVGFALDALGWGTKRETLKRVGWVLVLLGALAAVPAVVTGLAVEETVEQQLEPLPGGEAALEAHEELAIPTAAVLLGAALLRFLLEIRFRRPLLGRGLLIAYLVVGLVGAGMLALTGLRGGELVYRYGAGVRTDAAYVQPPPAELEFNAETED